MTVTKKSVIIDIFNSVQLRALLNFEAVGMDVVPINRNGRYFFK